MSKTIALTAVATFEVPIDDIAYAVGEELERARLKNNRQQVSLRTATRELLIAVEDVVVTLNRLENSTHTPGERAARDQFMSAVTALRTAYTKYRIKNHGN